MRPAFLIVAAIALLASCSSCTATAKAPASPSARPSASPGSTSSAPLDAVAVPTPMWAGYYLAAAHSVTSVTATWTQPSVWPKNTTWARATFWVGLQCRNGRSIEQIGTDGYSLTGPPADYVAWYQLYPRPSQPINVLTVSPGDTFTATVARFGSDCFRLTLVDHTTGRRFATTQIAKGVGRTAAGICVEEPVADHFSFAPFAAVHFTACMVDGRPLSDFAFTKYDIVGHEGMVMATTSDVTADGTGFSVVGR